MNNPILLRWPLQLAALLALTSGAAQATVYSFSYTRVTDNQVITGQLDGTLQADNNVVVVTSLVGATRLNGLAGLALPYVYSNDAGNFGTSGLLPRVSLNGAFMDFIACNQAADCRGPGDAFTFNVGNASAAAFGSGSPPSFAAYDGFYGAFSEPFVASRWVLSPVPEPDRLALFALGGILLACMARRAPARA